MGGLPELFGWLLMAAGFAVVAALGRAHRPILAALTVAFLLRAVLVFVHVHVAPLPGTGEDARFFEENAWTMARTGGSFLTALQSGSYAYAYVNSLVYGVFGRSVVLMLALNVTFGTLVAYNAYLLARMLWGERTGVWAAWVAALFPQLVLNSCVTLREVAVVYPLTLGVYFLVRWVREERTGDLPLGAGLILVSTLFHTSSIGVLAVFLLVFAYRSVRRACGPMPLAAFLVNLAFAAVVLGLAAFVVRFGEFGKLRLLTADPGLELLAQTQAGLAEARAAYLTGLTPTSLTDLLWQAPLRLLFLLFTPFPWMVRSGLDLLGFADAALYTALFALLVRSWPVVRRTPGAKTALAMALGSLLILGIGTSNYGTAIRHRAKYVAVLASLVAAPVFLRFSSSQPTAEPAGDGA